jgi:hypothetical protein
VTALPNWGCDGNGGEDVYGLGEVIIGRRSGRSWSEEVIAGDDV